MAAGIVGIAIYAGQMSDRMRRANEENQEQLRAMNSRVAGLSAEIRRAHVEVGALQRVLADRLRLEKVLSAPDLRLTRLAPLAPAPRANAIVAVSATNKAAVFQAVGLPATPAGKTYELWWITKEHGPVAAGLFQAEDGHPVVAPVALPPAGRARVAERRDAGARGRREQAHRRDVPQGRARPGLVRRPIRRAAAVVSEDVYCFG